MLCLWLRCVVTSDIGTDTYVSFTEHLRYTEELCPDYNELPTWKEINSLERLGSECREICQGWTCQCASNEEYPSR